jgi:hypothetical protein
MADLIKKETDKNYKKRMAELKLKLSAIVIQTIEKKTTLFDLIKESGIKNLVLYYNVVELTKKMVGKDGKLTKTAEKVFDLGIEFNNGIEIRHVSQPTLNLCKNYIPNLTVIKRRERVPNYNINACKQTKLDL